MWKTVFVLLGAFVGWAVVWFGSWPGLALFGVQVGRARDFRLAVTLGVVVFSLIGYWLGFRWERRARADQAPQIWQAAFAVLGALAGYVLAWFGCLVVFSAMGLKGGAAEAIAFFVGVPVGGATFSLLGLRFGTLLDGPLRPNASAQKWKLVLTALGTAIGPFVGHYCACFFVYESMGGDPMGRFLAAMHSLVQGAPSGGIVFCLLGLCLGSALDERSRTNDSVSPKSESCGQEDE